MGQGARDGRFVVLDGVDGCGKSTQAARLGQALEGERSEVLLLREPGSTALGEGIRALLLAPPGGGEIEAGVEALLFAAARRCMLAERVAPALERGALVICERFHPSTYAYQAVAGGLEEERVLALLEDWAGAPGPDLVLILDLDLERAADRRGPAGDRIEDKGASFQARVAAGYRRYAERAPGVRVVDASGTEEQVARRVLAEVRGVL